MKNSYRWSLSNLIASCIQRCKVSKSEFGSISIILYQSSDALSKLPNALSSFKVIIIVCVPGANERLSGFRILPTGTTEYLTPGSWARYTEYLLLAGCCLSLPSEVRCRKNLQCPARDDTSTVRFWPIPAAGCVAGQRPVRVESCLQVVASRTCACVGCPRGRSEITKGGLQADTSGGRIHVSRRGLLWANLAE